jgi:hypothetical protein
MITVDKTQESLSLAVGINEEEFAIFGDKVTKTCKEYADILLSEDAKSVTRLDFLETLATKFTEKELILLALTSFEDTLMKTIQFIQEEKSSTEEESANAITDADLVEDDEPATDGTVQAEAPYEPSSAPLGAPTPN